MSQIEWKFCAFIEILQFDSTRFHVLLCKLKVLRLEIKILLIIEIKYSKTIKRRPPGGYKYQRKYPPQSRKTYQDLSKPVPNLH